MGIRPRIEVDRSSPIPLYFQVAEQIAEAIRAGELAPGDQLDSEVQIAEALGLSRPTVRQAIGHLVDRGMIVRRRGVGTQILPMPVRREMELTSLHDDLARSGRAPGTDVLLLARVPAEPEAAAALGVPGGTQVTKVVRLRRSQGEPLALMRNWLPDPVPALGVELLETTGLYEVLRKAGIRICVARQRIGACTADQEQATLLEERRGAALLTMERTAFDDSGRAVEFGSHIYRASRYSLEVTVTEQ
ncbi:GntR family transcriptional regulator [Catenulispora yoronensis]|uniref:GntR family transcriptional regulator n=1 Tax=Catenulispora yoronensis TaxID=450799 RepID=A0ABN2U4P2_9ACTN